MRHPDEHLLELRQWQGTRLTVCRHCDRQTVTSPDATCRRCAMAMTLGLIDFLVHALSVTGVPEHVVGVAA